MELIPIHRDPEALKAARALYPRAFPREERAPFSLLVRRAKQGRADFLALREDGRQVGFVYMLREGSLAYIFYLAVEEADRGRGCGGRALEALVARYAGCRLFLALETQDPAAPNLAQRQARRAFYAHHGMQPLPGHIKEASVVYDIMGVGGPVAPEEYRRMIRRWMGPVRSRIIDMRLLP